MRKQITLLLLAVLAVATTYGRNQTATRAFDDYKRYYAEGLAVSDAEKEASIKKLREYFRTNDHRGHIIGSEKPASTLLGMIDDQGRFNDLVDDENAIIKEIHTSPYSATQGPAGRLCEDAWERIWKIATSYRNNPNRIDGLSDKYIKCILHYGELEIGRPNVNGRFLSSCFSMASAATATYFCFLSVMEDIESGKITDPDLINVCDMLKVVGLQAWTQPFRGDATDDNVVSTERFRKHVWWVGANGLAYRPLMQVAAMYRSIPMNNVLAETAQKAISYTSQQTFDDAFWTEGLTADGGGWGHGKQCCVWGYPVQGVLAAVEFLTQYIGTPWVAKLSDANKDALWVLLRGTSWFYHNGYDLPAIGRTTMQYNPSKDDIGSKKIIDKLVSSWLASFTSAEVTELKALQGEMKKRSIYMAAYPDGYYHGTRYYFNNDDLIKRTQSYHAYINMNSSRCDGVEMDHDGNDRYNFFLTDGATYFQRVGNEYSRTFGAFDITRAPGVTAREGMNQLKPVTDWSGYKGLYNFAGGATLGGANAVCGIHYEKAPGELSTPMLYKVESYKSYFFFGDYCLALGAGVTNKNQAIAGTIRTGIEQVIKTTGGTYIYDGANQTNLTIGTKYNFVENNQSKWVVQKGGFAYTVLPEHTKSNAYFMIETKMTDWDEMSKYSSNKKAKDSNIDVFSAWVDHGKTASNDTYGYVIYAGAGNPGELPFTVIRNDKKAQAAISKDGNIFQAVIYNPSETISGGEWSVLADHEAVVLIEKESDDVLNISVQDPTMNYTLKEIKIQINGNNLVVPMPQGDQAGKPAVMKVSLSGTPLSYADANNHLLIKDKKVEVSDMKGASLRVIDLNGITVTSTQIDSEFESVALSELTSGIYFVFCEYNGESFSKKIIL